jgi:hypothetical protein
VSQQSASELAMYSNPEATPGTTWSVAAVMVKLTIVPLAAISRSPGLVGVGAHDASQLVGAPAPLGVHSGELGRGHRSDGAHAVGTSTRRSLTYTLGIHVQWSPPAVRVQLERWMTSTRLLGGRSPRAASPEAIRARFSGVLRSGAMAFIGRPPLGE